MANMQPMVASNNQEKLAFARRLDTALRHAGIPPNRQRLKRVATMFGVSREAARKWLAGETMPDMKRIPEIARELHVRAEWLLTEEPPMAVGAEGSSPEGTAPGRPLGGEYSFIPMLEPEHVSLSAGNGSSVSYEVISQELAFRTSWLKNRRIPVTTSRILTVRGDSMAPFLMDGDVVLIDTSDTVVQNYKIYAVAVGDELRIKRLYRRPDGTLVMHSDNPNWTPREELITRADLEAGLVRIIGRMRWRGGEGDS